MSKTNFLGGAKFLFAFAMLTGLGMGTVQAVEGGVVGPGTPGGKYCMECTKTRVCTSYFGIVVCTDTTNCVEITCPAGRE